MFEVMASLTRDTEMGTRPRNTNQDRRDLNIVLG